MIGEMSLSQAAMVYGGTLLHPDCRFTSVSTDSRTLARGDLFVALEGERFDGHDYLAAVAKDACGLVVSREDKGLELPQWVVEDTVAALGHLAQLNRQQFTGTLLALTGSAGKTTVKEMMSAILLGCGPTHATQGNLNNHIGVPLTLLKLTADHQFCVLEMGASGPGEIAYLCEIATPDIALITNVLPAHMEGFGSEATIADTKGAIYRALPESGIAVVNLDEVWASQWLSSLSCGRTVTFSLKQKTADLYADAICDHGEEGSQFELHIDGQSRTVSLPLPGRHNVANALAAAGCAVAAGCDIDAIVAGLATVKAAKGRLQVRNGRRGSRIVDDTYNANPGSVRAAIDVLASLGGKKILALGEMAELGVNSPHLHRQVGEYACERGVDGLFVTGPFAQEVARGFGAGGQVFSNATQLAEALEKLLGDDLSVLVKGSRSAAMEKVVEQIVEEV